MLETFQKIWKFAGDERDNINKSIVFCFINAVFGCLRSRRSILPSGR